MMKRRDFISLLGGAAAGWPLSARAQQAMPVIGLLHVGLPEASTNVLTSFHRGLGEIGYVESRNVAIEYRWARNDPDRLPELASDLVRRQVAVIVALQGTAAALAAKAATTAIPIVFGTGADPVQTGLVASLSRPGGNVTGVSSLSGEVVAKRLGFLRELLPRATRFALLINPNESSAETQASAVQVAASTLERQLDVLTASTNREIDRAFASLMQKKAEALLVSGAVLFSERRVQIVTLATRYAVPAIYSARDYAEVGGLMSYGSNFQDAARLVGLYTGRVLKGEKPADLPIQQAAKFELVINLQTARVLDIEVPPTLLAQADELIE